MSESEEAYSLSSELNEGSSSSELDIDEHDLLDEVEELPKPTETRKRRKVQDSPSQQIAIASQASVASAKKVPTRSSATRATSKPEEAKTGITPLMSSLKLEEKEDVLGDCLDGLTIVVSGIFESISREKLEEFINSHGGRNTGSVSGKTSYLVVGYKLEDNREIN